MQTEIFMATLNDLLRALVAGARAVADVAEAALAAEAPAPVVSAPGPNALLPRRGAPSDGDRYLGSHT